MTDTPDQPPTEGSDDLKLSKSTLRKVKKLATGPLLGPIPPLPPKRINTGELAAKVAPLGSILTVRARLGQSLDGDNRP